MIKLATVFSGIGSIEWALKRLEYEHEIIFACDNGEVNIRGINEEEVRKKVKTFSNLNDQKAYIDSLIENERRTNFVKKAYLANYKISESHFHHDVRFIDGTKYLNNVDLFVGGSPCQSFSMMGYKNGLNDARGTLFYDFARLVKEIKPKVFIYENVQGLLRHDKGNTWEIINGIFNKLNYKLFIKVLDAKHYGIPQTRRRIVVVGFIDKNVNFKFPIEKPLKYVMKDFLIENVSFGNYKRVKSNIKLIKDKVGIVDEKYYLSEKVYKHVMSTGTKNYVTIPEIDLEIARPLLATMHKMHRAAVDNYVTSYKGVRRLTPRECLRLMGFDDDFKQVVSDLQTYRQAGNSIVVDVMMEVMKEIMKTGALK